MNHKMRLLQAASLLARVPAQPPSSWGGFTPAAQSALLQAGRAYSSKGEWKGHWGAAAAGTAALGVAAAALIVAGDRLWVRPALKQLQEEQQQSVLQAPFTQQQQHEHEEDQARSGHGWRTQQPQQQQQQQQHFEQPPLPSWLQHLLSRSTQHLVAVADAAAAQQQQQQQQQAAWVSAAAAGGSVPGSSDGSQPLSGAIALLDEQGLTNHPLDYNPITNEHTAAMTLAKQAGLEAYQAGRYAEAERRFQEVVEEAKLGFPPGDPHIPSALHCLAEFYRNVGRLDDAEPLYRQVVAQLSDSLGERHWMYSAALCSLAGLHEARGQYSEAIELLETALDLRRQLFSSSSFLYADTAALLARTLMQQHKAAAAAGDAGTPVAAAAASGGSSWYSRLRGSSSSRGQQSAVGPASVLRAIDLWQQAVTIVEESGGIAHSPAAAWLVDMAAAQQEAGQHTAAVASLQKALDYMALPQEQDQEQDKSGSSSSRRVANTLKQHQQQVAGAAGSTPDSSSSSSSGGDGVGGVGEGTDTLTAVLAASGGNMELARLKLAAMGSEVAERLVDAQLSAGDLPGARHTLRLALEARIALLGRHLVVAKTMTRLANLLMQSPPDPSAPQLAPHFASSAVAIADAALQTAQRGRMWAGMVRGALKALQSASFGSVKAGLEAERTVDRLLAGVQLGNACLALAAAEKMNGHIAEAESALRHGVSELRWVLGVGAADLERISSRAVEASMLQRVGGLLVDLKLVQMDCLEALATLIREQHAAAGSADDGGGAAATKASKKGGAAAVVEPKEAAALLAEADQLAAELV